MIDLRCGQGEVTLEVETEFRQSFTISITFGKDFLQKMVSFVLVDFDPIPTFCFDHTTLVIFEFLRSFDFAEENTRDLFVIGRFAQPGLVIPCQITPLRQNDSIRVSDPIECRGLVGHC